MNAEIYEKIAKCKDVNEVLKLAKANNKNITREEAEKAFDMAHANGELSDEEISNVSGGSCNGGRSEYEIVAFKDKESVQFIFKVGDVVEAYVGKDTGSTTYTGVVERLIAYRENSSVFAKYFDAYDIKNLKTGFTDIHFRNQIEKK